MPAIAFALTAQTWTVTESLSASSTRWGTDALASDRSNSHNLTPPAS